MATAVGALRRAADEAPEISPVRVVVKARGAPTPEPAQPLQAIEIETMRQLRMPALQACRELGVSVAQLVVACHRHRIQYPGLPAVVTDPAVERMQAALSAKHRMPRHAVPGPDAVEAQKAPDLTAWLHGVDDGDVDLRGWLDAQAEVPTDRRAYVRCLLREPGGAMRWLRISLGRCAVLAVEGENDG